MNATTMLLKEATQKLPPEILRIIASKYRRQYELNGSLFLKARTIQYSQEDDNAVWYIIDGYRYIVYRHVYGANKPYNMQLIYDTKLLAILYYYTNTTTFQCDLFENISVSVLHNAMILFKRHGYIVDRKSLMQVYDVKKDRYVSSLLPLHRVLYDKNYPWRWKKTHPNARCSIM
jgi:hypothetical protein